MEKTLKQFLDEGIEAIHTQEIQDEASALLATIAEGSDVEDIIRELYLYSQSVVAMCITKTLRLFYTDETIDQMVQQHTTNLGAQLADEVEAFLGGN